MAKELQIGKNKYELVTISTSCFINSGLGNYPLCPDITPLKVEKQHGNMTEFTYPVIIIDGIKYGIKLIGGDFNTREDDTAKNS